MIQCNCNSSIANTCMSDFLVIFWYFSGVLLVYFWCTSGGSGDRVVVRVVAEVVAEVVGGSGETVGGVVPVHVVSVDRQQGHEVDENIPEL